MKRDMRNKFALIGVTGALVVLFVAMMFWTKSRNEPTVAIEESTVTGLFQKDGQYFRSTGNMSYYFSNEKGEQTAAGRYSQLSRVQETDNWVGRHDQMFHLARLVGPNGRILSDWYEKITREPDGMYRVAKDRREYMLNSDGSLWLKTVPKGICPPFDPWADDYHGNDRQFYLDRLSLDIQRLQSSQTACGSYSDYFVPNAAKAVIAGAPREDVMVHVDQYVKLVEKGNQFVSSYPRRSKPEDLRSYATQVIDSWVANARR